MYVVFNTGTGWSDESMRFATEDEALEWINGRNCPWNYSVREES